MDRENPFQEIERFFDQFSSGFEGLEQPGLGGSVAVDVADLGDAFEVTADLPGFDSDDIDVTLPDPRTVRITASEESTTESESGSDDRRYIRQERHGRSISRSVSLPANVAESEASASYENGVLTVTLPKQTTGDETEIPVS